MSARNLVYGGLGGNYGIIRGMGIARNNRRFNWQQKGWPAATVDRTALRGELAAKTKVVVE